MFSALSTLTLWVSIVLAQTSSSVFDFPEYPPPGTPGPYATLANAAAPLPYGISDDPALSEAVIHYDTGFFGPQIELVHAYYNYWPTGVGVASDGTIFTCFPRGNETFTLAVFNSSTSEAAWPNEEWNTPPAFYNESNPGYSIATDKLLFIQSVVVDGADRVWALDTGRPRVNGTYLFAAVPGGPKLVGFYLNGTSFVTYTFPDYVVYADSSLNDVRIDLRGEGYAYITDSSPYRPAIVVINLSTGESWRHLDGSLMTSPDPAFVPVYDGVPFYYRPIAQPNVIQRLTAFAADGIALSADGEYLYVTPLTSRRLYRVPTSYLKQQPSSTNPNAYMLARENVQNVGEFGGHADGLETDSTGYIYLGSQEHNAIHRYNITTGLVEPFIRTPVIQVGEALSSVLRSATYSIDSGPTQCLSYPFRAEEATCTSRSISSGLPLTIRTALTCERSRTRCSECP